MGETETHTNTVEKQSWIIVSLKKELSALMFICFVTYEAQREAHSEARSEVKSNSLLLSFHWDLKTKDFDKP